MAEGGRSERPLIKINVHVVKQGDKVEVQGDIVRHKTNVSAEVIDNLSVSAPPDDARYADIADTEGLHLGQQRDSHANWNPGVPPDDAGYDDIPEMEDLHLRQQRGSPANLRPREHRVEADAVDSKKTTSDAMKIYRLGERSNDLMGQSKYLKALEQLWLLNSVQPNQLKTMMMIAECKLMLDKQEEALKVIFETEKLMAPSDVRDIIDESDICVKGGLYLRAMIFLFCAAKASAEKKPQSEALLSVGECVDKIDACSQAVTYDAKYLTAYRTRLMIPFMREVVNDLGKIADCDEDSKVHILARCMGNIADSYRQLEKYRKALKMYHECMSMMDRQYGLHASKFRCYAEFLVNVAYCHMRLTEYEEARLFYRRSIPARAAAEDFKDEEERESFIENSKRALRHLEGRTSDR